MTIDIINDEKHPITHASTLDSGTNPYNNDAVDDAIDVFGVNDPNERNYRREIYHIFADNPSVAVNVWLQFFDDGVFVRSIKIPAETVYDQHFPVPLGGHKTNIGVRISTTMLAQAATGVTIPVRIEWR